MPDWSFYPLLRPLSAWLPGDARRTLALRGLQAIAAAPGGSLLIELLGRMKPDDSLATTVYGRTLISPIGVGGGVDPDAVAISGLGRFGVGFVEVGPYVLGSVANAGVIAEPLIQGSKLQSLNPRLTRRPYGVSVWLRLVVAESDPRATSAIDHLVGSSHQIDVVCISMVGADGQLAAATVDRWRSIIGACEIHDIAAVLADIGASKAPRAAQAALSAGAKGFVVRSDAASSSPAEPRETLQALRRSFPSALLVAGCGASSPREVLEQIDAGAQLVAVDGGLIAAGPGLPKRANEALAGRRSPLEAMTAAQKNAGLGWWWALVLGAGMLVAGMVILAVGLTRVVLPYDETFLGIGRDALPGINPRLLAFMQHDRVTLAGTLLSIGVLYASLGWNGLRGGWRWARDALLASGAVGFASLFLFLGFHYIDPLQVTLTATLFPLFILGVLLPLRRRSHASRDLDNDAAWRLGLMGQLLFIGLGAGLTIAGLTISAVGVTRVFVFSDLAFLQTTSSAINTANSHLLPLIAHDRAGFGGALASDGIAVLLMSLWGFRRGERWVWWTLLLAGLVGLSGGLYAHLAVGYLEFGHLLPLFVSALVFALALAFSSAYLLDRPARGV